MKPRTFALLTAFLCASAGRAAAATPPGTEEQILALEKQWAAAIQRQDVAAMPQFLSDGYFLGIGVAGVGFRIVPRAAWLETLKVYETKAFTIDDAQVHIYGDTAVAFMLVTQEATVNGQDRSGQFVITDVWVKEPAGWRVAERHSSRPEPKPAARP
jgi:ketosteroid isomerase-like protein